MVEGQFWYTVFLNLSPHITRQDGYYRATVCKLL